MGFLSASSRSFRVRHRCCLCAKFALISLETLGCDSEEEVHLTLEVANHWFGCQFGETSCIATCPSVSPQIEGLGRVQCVSHLPEDCGWTASGLNCALPGNGWSLRCEKWKNEPANLHSSGVTRLIASRQAGSTVSSGRTEAFQRRN